MMHDVPFVKTTALRQEDSEQLETLYRLADFGMRNASLLHDISNPLLAAALCLQDCSTHNRDTIQQAKRNIETLRRYIVAAQLQAQRRSNDESFCIDEVFARLQDVLQPLAKRRNVTLRFVAPKKLTLYGDPVKLQRLITNLATNAIEACAGTNTQQPRMPRVTIAASLLRHGLTIEVRDNGNGIRAEDLPHIFKPFFSTKGNTGASGLGLGLYTAKRTVEDDFGGTLAVKTRETGTKFTIHMPRERQRHNIP